MSLVLIVLGIIVIAVLVFSFNHKPINNSKSKTKPKSSVLTTSNGTVVPSQWVARAKSVGYYCPSWLDTNGEIGPDICYPLKK